jgi:hypothetical protein
MRQDTVKNVTEKRNLGTGYKRKCKRENLANKRELSLGGEGKKLYIGSTGYK